jgi:23S rRNA (uracil1939-C5)-methyltransferase
MAVGGAGVGRLSEQGGLVVFVPFSAPGDEVEVKTESRHAIGRTTRVLKPSALRQDAPCEYFGQCGGCLWQHLRDEVQIQQKELILTETLKKFVPSLEFTLEKTVSTVERLGYRNRIQLKQLGSTFGYFRQGTHDIVPISNCLIAEPAIQKALPQLLQKLPASKELKKWEIRIDQSEEVSLTPVGARGEGIAFSQVNRFINEHLVSATRDIVRNLNPKSITELYAGAGNFTFELAQLPSRPQVTAVEASSQLTTTAVKRALDIGLHRAVTFFTTTCEVFCQSSQPISSELVVLDPPREGCDPSVLERLLYSRPRDIVYISCHPVNFARDLQRLSSRYRVARIQIFDMFPQTDHFETLCHLSRKDLAP